MAEDLSECKVKNNKEDVLKYMKEYLLAKTSNPENAAVLKVESDCKKSADEVEADVKKTVKKIENIGSTIGGIINLF